MDYKQNRSLACRDRRSNKSNSNISSIFSPQSSRTKQWKNGGEIKQKELQMLVCKKGKEISALSRTSSQDESSRGEQEPVTARLFHPVAATDDILAEEQYRTCILCPILLLSDGR